MPIQFTAKPMMLNTDFSPLQLQILSPGDGERFESFCLDLYREEFGTSAQKNGRPGQRQNGVDIIVSDQKIGIQCKKKDYYNGKITKKELRNEVEKAKTFQPNLKQFILAATCKRDANIQKEARLISEKHNKNNLFSVAIHSWDEIKELLEKHPKVYHKYSGNSNSYPNKNNVSQSVIRSDLIFATGIQSIKADTHHSELNRIRDLLLNKQNPKAAFDLLTNFKNEKWDTLDDKTKYRTLSYMGDAKLKMRNGQLASDFFIQAFQFNKEDETACTNCALAYFIKDNMAQAMEYVTKARKLNPANIAAYSIEMQIQFKEGKSIEDITQNIPKDIVNKPQITYLLAFFNVKKEHYKEAEKWARIFYAKCDKQDYIMASSYADCMLQIIERHIYTKGKITPQFQTDLEQIIAIYKRLYTERSESNKFNPNLYLNYAVALKLNQNTDKAIGILKECQDIFPEDYELQEFLVYLLLCKEAGFSRIVKAGQNEGVLFYPNELFTQANQKNLNNIAEYIENIPKEKRNEFMWAVLVDIKYCTASNKKQEAINWLKKTCRIQTLSYEDKFVIASRLIDKLIELNALDEAEQELNALYKLYPDNPFILLISAQIENRRGNKEKQKEYINKAAALEPQHKNNTRFIYLLARELYFCKMYNKCEHFFEQIINNNFSHPDIFKLLHIYFENGQNTKAISLAKNLQKEFPKETYPANILFLIYNDLGDRKRAIQVYESFVKNNPENNPIKIELILAYIRHEQLDCAKSLLSEEFNLAKLSEAEISKLAFAYSRIGDIKKALDILYKSIKKDPNSWSLQSLYFEMITFRNKNKSEGFLSLKEVKRDCYVKYKELPTGDEEAMILEENAEKTSEHLFSKLFLGKKLEDIIHQNNKQYKILDIKHKYIHKYHQILKEAEKRFPLKPFIRSASIPNPPTKEGIEQAFRTLMPDLTQQEKTTDKAFQYYKQGKLCIGSLARVMGKHPIEIINILMQSTHDKFISSRAGDTNSGKLNKINNTSNIIIDLSALFFLHSIKIEKFFEQAPFNIYICQSTIDSIKDMRQKMDMHSKKGLLKLGWNQNNQMVKTLTPAQDIQQNMYFLEKIIKWADKFCKTKPVPVGYVMSRKKKLAITHVIGKEFLDSILAACDQKNTLLLCEDGILGVLSQNEFKVSRVRLFDIIRWFAAESIINNEELIQYKSALVKYNQTYIPVDHKVLG